MKTYNIPLVIRGRIIAGNEVTHFGRRDRIQFTTPAVGPHLRDLALAKSQALADLYDVSFDEIVDYLGALGAALSFRKNGHLQEAFEVSTETSGLSDLLRRCYEDLARSFDRDLVRDSTEKALGIPFLEGWVERRLADGSRMAIRAFGARGVHVVAGNVPSVSAMTVVRNAVSRSDAIIKAPSNDPLTAVAIARTMIDMAPDHPLTRHLSVAYWKGGDTTIEDVLYQPRNIEKIVAWGGLASVSHIAKYVQPGIDLITLDPKLSSTIIGRAAFESDVSMRLAAERLAMDIGVYNQESCACARVVYVETGTDEIGLTKANQFGAYTYEALQALPSYFSSPAATMDLQLAAELQALKLNGEWHKVIGGGPEGAVVVSQTDEPVDFAPQLQNRVANVVPIDDLSIPVSAVTSYTQTIGIYPDDLKESLRDTLALAGAQRVVSLGGAGRSSSGGPQDGIEPLRRMCKWIRDETRNSEQLRIG